MNILVTGGNGYIGSIISKILSNRGHKVTIIDNLQSSKGLSNPSIPYVIDDFSNPKVLPLVFRDCHTDLVIHLAASMSPTDSVSNPKEYFQNNIIGSINLLNMMLNQSVKNIIFASSGCVYGTPKCNPVFEDQLEEPTTPYGESKLMFEGILEWYYKAYGLNYIAFRFHNVSGATDSLGSNKPYNNGLIFKTIDVALGKGLFIPVYGNNYSTPDGSCIRDYVHIKDLAQAFTLAIDKIKTNSGVYNLGSGFGSSVFQVIKEVKKVSGKSIDIKIEPRRPGDPAILIADITKAEKGLGWKPQYSNLNTIIQDSWDWASKEKGGN